MTPTPHGQVPEALIDLIDAYAETRHRCGGVYNAKTEAARNAVIEALSGGQALSAAPEAKKSALRTYPNPIVPLIKPVSEQEKMRALYLASSNLMAYLGRNGAIHSDGHAADVLMNCLNDLDGGEFDETLFAASPTPPAEQAAPKAAPGEPSDTSFSQFLSDVMTAAGLVSHGKQCKALGDRLADMVMRLRTAPQQEAQEPAFWMNEKGHTWSHSDWKQFPKHRAKYPIPLYPHFPAPQPAPDCHHRPPCAECAALAAQGDKE